MWVHFLGVCWSELPGLTWTIVFIIWHAAAALKQFQYPCTYNVQLFNSCCHDISRGTDGVGLWCYVTAITQRDVTQSWKQSFKWLCTVSERWPDQTHCDLCDSEFSLYHDPGQTLSPLGLLGSHSETSALTKFLFMGQHNLCGVTEKNSPPTNPSSFRRLLVIIDPWSS